MRVFLLSLFMVFFTLSYASVVGTVEKINGTVKVKSEGSIKKSKIKAGFDIKAGDLVSTSRKGSAVIKLVDGSMMVLDAKSSVHFTALNDAQQQSGKVYYKITSKNANNALKIKTPFAIIGIKGTTFIIDADTDNASVTLKEGLIGVASIKEEFALYRKQLEEEFNKYLTEQKEGFEAYKKGMAEMTKNFDLKEGNSISFNGQNAKESGWTKEDDLEFDYFESLIDPNSPKNANKYTYSQSEPTKSTQAETKDITPVKKQAPKKEFDDTWNDDDDAEFDEIESRMKAIK